MKRLIFTCLLFLTTEANAFVCHIIKSEGNEYRFKFRITYGRFNNGLYGGALKSYSDDSQFEFASIGECTELTASGFSCSTNRWPEGSKGLQVTRQTDGIYLVTAYTHYPKEKYPYYDLREHECTVLQGGK